MSRKPVALVCLLAFALILAPLAANGGWSIQELGEHTFGVKTLTALGEGPENTTASLDQQIQVDEDEYDDDQLFPLITGEGGDPDPFEEVSWEKNIHTDDEDGLAPWDTAYPLLGGISISSRPSDRNVAFQSA